MKRTLWVMILSLLVLLPAVRADGPDEDYVNIYTLIQQADNLNDHGQTASAVTKYTEAENALKRLQTNYPSWSLKVVKFRLNYLATKIAQLTTMPAVAATTNAPAKAPETLPAAPPSPAPAPTTVEPPKAVPAPPPSEAELQVKALQERVRQVEADKTLLEAKLKEALASQPAAVNPQELAKAQEQILSLQKENELLKASVAQARTNASPVTTANAKKLQETLAEANRKVAQLTEANAALALEKEALQNRVQTLAAPDTAAALREENTVLRKQVADLQSRATTSASAEDLDRKLKAAQAQVAVLQSDKEILRLEKITLENRAKQAAAAQPVPAPTLAPAPAAPVTNQTAAPSPMMDSVTANKIAQLEAQRDELLKSLNAATRDVQGRKKGKETAARLDEMARQVGTLRARIEVLEAQPIPYTEAELALLSNPGMTLSASVRSPVRKPAKELPAGAAPMLAEAKRYFVAHELDKAEAKYLELLKLDEKNVVTLADLAAIQIELGRTAEAEKHVKAALAVEPDDDYSLFIMGQLKFRQKSYDEALDVLSRAAQLNPKNAKVQNLLGLSLSEKGLRAAAETAFRKAIQLDPGFAEAHLNLAVVYITQKPPLAELARWHYQKALAAGHPPSPDLEKLLDPDKTVTGAAH